MNDSRPLGVSEFLGRVNELLETQVAWVEGEAANVAIAQGKWLHFDLKDAHSLVHCFGVVYRLRTPLEDGMTVRLWGVPRVYPRSGRFSLLVERLELVGEGALRRARELLKATLEREGLFDPARKRPLPRFPERIALLTSPEAAAYDDVLKVLSARWGGLTIDVVPVPVQGRDAPEGIARAIDGMNAREPLADVLVLVRGGGSLEDLQAFNDERVVRALARSRIPTLVGVGHERDVTLADQVADVRASTPSHAAELLVPTKAEMNRACQELARRLTQALEDQVQLTEERLGHQVRLLRDAVRHSVERLDLVARRMGAVGARLQGQVRVSLERLDDDARLLRDRLGGIRTAREERLAGLERLLAGLHPARVLARGFSITTGPDGRLLREAHMVKTGDRLATRLAHGTLESHTTKVHGEGTDELFARV